MDGNDKQILNKGLVHRRFIRLVVIAVGLGAFTDSYNSVAVGAVNHSMIPALGLSTLEYGWVTSMLAVGAFIGALAFGVLADVIGRRKAFIATLVIFIIGVIFSAVSQNYYELLASRVIVGFGIGADFSPAYTLLSEVSDPANRGRVLTTFMIMFSLGVSAVFLVAYVLVPTHALQWRYVFLTAAIPPAISLILRLRIPESPRWLLTHGEEKEARNSFKIMGLDPDVEISNLMKSSQYSKEASHDRWKEFKPYVLPVTIPLFIVTALATMSTYGLVIWVPIILIGLHVQPSLILIYIVLTFAFPQLVGSIISYFITDKYGRRVPLLLGLGVYFVFLFLMGIFSHMTTLLLLFLIVASVFSYIMNPQTFSLGSEFYKVNTRGIGTGINSSATRLGDVITGFGGALLISAFGDSGLLIFFGVAVLIAFLISATILYKRLDISGKSLEDISDST